MKIGELVKESTIIQGVATVIVLGADAYLACTGQPIPDLLALCTTALMGFWFGTKVPYNAARAANQ